MRGLTEEELKLAPDWATHWYFYNNLMEHITFENEFMVQTYYVKSKKWSLVAKRKSNIAKLAKPLPKKPFDMTKHNLSEQDFYFDLLEDGIAVVDGHINKKDAIAIAKALGVTAEDLK